MKKRTPETPYECWCMPCKECSYWDDESKKCTHPEAEQWDIDEGLQLDPPVLRIPMEKVLAAAEISMGICITYCSTDF